MLLDTLERSTNEEEGLDPTIIGQIREPSLFELVKRTLREAESQSKKGYLMTIIGGDICDVSDPHSDLMQAVKFVSENTDDKNTLTVITRACSKNNDDLSSTAKRESENVPVYAKGMLYYKVSNTI